MISINYCYSNNELMEMRVDLNKFPNQLLVEINKQLISLISNDCGIVKIIHRSIDHGKLLKMINNDTNKSLANSVGIEEFRYINYYDHGKELKIIPNSIQIFKDGNVYRVIGNEYFIAHKTINDLFIIHFYPLLPDIDERFRQLIHNLDSFMIKLLDKNREIIYYNQIPMGYKYKITKLIEIEKYFDKFMESEKYLILPIDADEF